MSLRVHIQVPINESGYGQDGKGILRTFTRMGSYVTCQPINVVTPIPEDIANIFTHQPDYPFDLFINHVSPDAIELPEDVKGRAYKKIAWSMWEWDTFGAEENAERVRNNLEGYDLVLGYDDISVAAFKSTGTTVPVMKLQGGYDPDLWSKKDGSLPERDWFAEEFVFVIAGELSLRKNPYVLCKALKPLYEEGYKFKLVMKNRFDDHIPPHFADAYPFLELHSGETWPQERMRDMYERAHCYVAPSMGEGKNLPPIEAGTTGCAMILSDIAGHREWARSEFAKFVGGKWSTYDAGAGCLYVDEGELREACREMMDDRLKAQYMGKLAHDILPASMSWESVIRRLTSEILPRIR